MLFLPSSGGWGGFGGEVERPCKDEDGVESSQYSSLVHIFAAGQSECVGELGGNLFLVLAWSALVL